MNPVVLDWNQSSQWEPKAFITEGDGGKDRDRDRDGCGYKYRDIYGCRYVCVCVYMHLFPSSVLLRSIKPINPRSNKHISLSDLGF